MLVINRVQSLLTVSALIFFSVSQAAVMTMPYCAANDISTPCVGNVWEFSGDALYYGSGSINTFDDRISSGATSLSLTKKSADYGWGFRLGTGFHFSSANALLLDWLHYRKTTPQIQDQSGGAFPTNQTLNVTSKLDMVNLSLEQILNLGERLDLGILTGLQYGDVATDWHLVQANTPITQIEQLTYQAVGVRLGLKGVYNLNQWFSIYALGAFSYLYGKELSDNSSQSPGYTSFYQQDYRAFRKEADTAIGVNLKTIFTQGLLISKIAWDNIYYSVGTGFSWTGLSFGMKYIG